MVWVGDGRVPKRHDGIAHEFVDGAAMAENVVGERCEERIHKLHHRFRVHAFAQAREAADVGEQQRDFARFAAELQTGGILCKLRDDVRGHIVAEGGPDARALRLGADIVREGAGEIYGDQGERGIDWINQETAAVGKPGQGRDCYDRYHRDCGGGGCAGRGDRAARSFGAGDENRTQEAR